jgi:hypothetical protein
MQVASYLRPKKFRQLQYVRIAVIFLGPPLGGVYPQPKLNTPKQKISYTPHWGCMRFFWIKPDEKIVWFNPDDCTVAYTPLIGGVCDCAIVWIKQFCVQLI